MITAEMRRLHSQRLPGSVGDAADTPRVGEQRHAADAQDVTQKLALDDNRFMATRTQFNLIQRLEAFARSSNRRAKRLRLMAGSMAGESEWLLLHAEREEKIAKSYLHFAEARRKQWGR